MEMLNDNESCGGALSFDTLALEDIIKDERTKEITHLNLLPKKVYYLHTDLLYYRNANTKLGTACYDAWRLLVKKVGGTRNGWRDLGHALGISHDDLDYIMNSLNDDRADMVLKVFRQNEKATIDKILDVFVKMQRYDILKSIEEPLCTIAQNFNKDDSGYHSNSNGKSSGQREIITLKNVPNDLPPALNKKYIIKKKEPNRPKKPSLQPPMAKTEKVANDNPILFLTFASDGLPTAINIQEYVENWDVLPAVKVITLNTRRDEIYQNPEKFIREYFEKADFIVPIITPGYLEEIKSHNVNIPNTTESLDHKYVNFIYNLIVNQYIHASGCLNMKVRSVLPQNSNANLSKSIVLYPDLLPWTYEIDFDEQFQSFFEKEQSL